jgi:hypothetical protein
MTGTNKSGLLFLSVALVLLCGCPGPATPPVDPPVKPAVDPKPDPSPSPSPETEPKPDSVPTPVSGWGSFSGNPKTEWIEDLNYKLLEEFSYTDKAGKTWIASKDSVVNGASIPRAFWTIIGSPTTGKYRNASIVHDTACEGKVETWQDVHLMFYEACRCGGLGEKKAKVMYWAVYHGGPRWKKSDIPGLSEIAPGERTEYKPRVLTDDDLKKIEEKIEANDNISLEQLMALENP